MTVDIVLSSSSRSLRTASISYIKSQHERVVVPTHHHYLCSQTTTSKDPFRHFIPHQIIPRSSVEKASLQLLQLHSFHRTRIGFLLHQRLHAPIIIGSTLCHTGVALCNSGHTAQFCKTTFYNFLYGLNYPVLALYNTESKKKKGERKCIEQQSVFTEKKVLVTPWVNPQIHCICNCLIKFHI